MELAGVRMRDQCKFPRGMGELMARWPLVFGAKKI